MEGHFVVLLFIHVWCVKEAGPGLNKHCLIQLIQCLQLWNNYPTNHLPGGANSHVKLQILCNCDEREVETYACIVAGDTARLYTETGWRTAGCPDAPWIDFRMTLLSLRPVSLRWCPSTLYISTELFTVKQLGTTTSCTNLPDLDTNFTPFFLAKLLKPDLFRLEAWLNHWCSVCSDSMPCWKTNHLLRMSAGRNCWYN